MMKEGIYLLGFKVVNGLLDRLKGELLDKADLTSVEECPVISVSCKPLKKTLDKPESRVYDCHCYGHEGTVGRSSDHQKPLFTVVGF
jgi:hypothetical protein